MPSFSKRSLYRLNTCHSDLQEILHEVIKDFDCTILEGHRSQIKQAQYFKEGKSKLDYPHSKHNSEPSAAVDVVPYPIDWLDTARMTYLAGIIMATAKEKGIKLRWGGDWDRDTQLLDNRFNDLPHFELID